jgi:hypothetical protein
MTVCSSLLLRACESKSYIDKTIITLSPLPLVRPHLLTSVTQQGRYTEVRDVLRAHIYYEWDNGLPPVVQLEWRVVRIKGTVIYSECERRKK